VPAFVKGAAVVQNAPGCPPPSVSSGSAAVQLTWSSACVDPGEKVSVHIGAPGPVTDATFAWSPSPPAIALTPGQGIACDFGLPPKCHVSLTIGDTASGVFSVFVNATAIRAGGYGGFSAEITFAGLAYQSRTCLTEVIWPDKFLCAALSQPDERSLTSASAVLPPYFPSMYVGPLAEVQLRCSDLGTFEIALGPGTKYVAGDGSIVAVNSSGSLTVNCESTASVGGVALDPTAGNPTSTASLRAAMLAATLLAAMSIIAAVALIAFRRRVR
jgi:hypothetical protein